MLPPKTFFVQTGKPDETSTVKAQLFRYLSKYQHVSLNHSTVVRRQNRPTAPPTNLLPGNRSARGPENPVRGASAAATAAEPFIAPNRAAASRSAQVGTVVMQKQQIAYDRVATGRRLPRPRCQIWRARQ